MREQLPRTAIKSPRILQQFEGGGNYKNGESSALRYATYGGNTAMKEKPSRARRLHDTHYIALPTEFDRPLLSHHQQLKDRKKPRLGTHTRTMAQKMRTTLSCIPVAIGALGVSHTAYEQMTNSRITSPQMPHSTKVLSHDAPVVHKTPKYTFRVPDRILQAQLIGQPETRDTLPYAIQIPEKKAMHVTPSTLSGCGGNITDAQRISHGKNIHHLLSFPNSASVEAIQELLDVNNSPVAHLKFTDTCGHIKTFAEWVYDLCKSKYYHIDDAIVLGIFNEESKFGKNGEAVLTYSVGNIRPANGLGYNNYNDWASSAEDVTKLLKNYIKWGWGPDVDNAISHWAPWGDSNNPVLYAQTVKDTMDTLYAESMTLSHHEARRWAKETLAQSAKKNMRRTLQAPRGKAA